MFLESMSQYPLGSRAFAWYSCILTNVSMDLRSSMFVYPWGLSKRHALSLGKTNSHPSCFIDPITHLKRIYTIRSLWHRYILMCNWTISEFRLSETTLYAAHFMPIKCRFNFIEFRWSANDVHWICKSFKLHAKTGLLCSYSAWFPKTFECSLPHTDQWIFGNPISN